MRDFEIDPLRFAIPDEMPPGAKRALKVAKENGWDAHAMRLHGHDVDTTHYDAQGNWDTHRVEMVGESVVDESGKPELTPTGKPKVRKVPRLVDGVPVPVTSTRIVVTAAKDGQRGMAVWELLSTTPSWAFRFAAISGAGSVTSAQFLTYLRGPDEQLGDVQSAG